MRLEERRVRLLTPTNSCRKFRTTVNTNTSTICMKKTTFNTQTCTGGFKRRRLLHTVSATRVRNEGLCLAIGALLGGERLSRRLCSCLLPCCGRNLSTIVIRSVNIFGVVERVFPNVRLRTDARVAIANPRKVGFLRRRNTSEIMATERLSLRRVQEVRRADPVRVRSFVRKTLYCDCSKRYLVDDVLNKEDNGEKEYTRPYHLPCRATLYYKRGNEQSRGEGTRRLYPLDLGSVSAVRVLPRVLRTNIASLGVRNEVGRPKCATKMASMCQGCLSLLFRGKTRGCEMTRRSGECLLSLFGEKNSYANCCRVRGNPSVVTFDGRGGAKSIDPMLEGGGRGVRKAFVLFPKDPTVLSISYEKVRKSTTINRMRCTRGRPLARRHVHSRVRGLKGARCR